MHLKLLFYQKPITHNFIGLSIHLCTFDNGPASGRQVEMYLIYLFLLAAAVLPIQSRRRDKESAKSETTEQDIWKYAVRVPDYENERTGHLPVEYQRNIHRAKERDTIAERINKLRVHKVLPQLISFLKSKLFNNYDANRLPTTTGVPPNTSPTEKKTKINQNKPKPRFEIDDKVIFNGDTCPSHHIKIGLKCVEEF